MRKYVSFFFLLIAFSHYNLSGFSASSILFFLFSLNASLYWYDACLVSGKSVGVVTSTRITHATPAAAYAKTPSRDWESDEDMKDTGCDTVKDIARQLVEDNKEIQV